MLQVPACKLKAGDRLVSNSSGLSKSYYIVMAVDLAANKITLTLEALQHDQDEIFYLKGGYSSTWSFEQVEGTCELYGPCLLKRKLEIELEELLK